MEKVPLLLKRAASSPSLPSGGTRRVSLPLRLFLGVDGGGTRTTAWISDERGRIRGRGTAGPANPLRVGGARAQDEILRAVRRASRTLAHPPARWEGVCLGVAGAERTSVRRPLTGWARQALPARHHIIVSDAAIALEAAFAGTPGILVIAGTGSIAYGRNSAGRVLRAGGWGVPFDDLGSGYDLGLKAVSAALRAADGRGPKTRLAGRLARALRVSDITQVAGRSFATHRIAALLPVILKAARSGDRVARELCRQAGSDLAGMALAVRRQFPLPRVPIVCAGGVFTASSLIRRSFARLVRERAPGTPISLLRRAPVEGALALARRAAR